MGKLIQRKSRKSIIASVEERKKHKMMLVQYVILIAFSFILYANTIPNDYALDDSFVVIQNKFTQEGVAGIKDILSSDQFAGKYGVKKNIVIGGRYRPLSIITFAISL